MRTIAYTIAAGALIWWCAEGGGSTLGTLLTLIAIIISLSLIIKEESK